MKISVVIMAYNRRKFLKYAIESAANQSLGKENFEILLIKNFQDDEIDKICIEHSIKAILTSNVPIGEYISIALKNSSGDVLCFLDDDDAFEKNKLEVVYGAFSRNAALTYMRNDWSLIDAEGKPIPSHSDEPNGLKVPIEYYDVNYALNRVGLGFRWNMSCISVRKEIFEGFEAYLPRIIAAQDLIVFYISASKYKTLARCRLPLTQYRIHENSMTKVKGSYNDALREYNSLKPLEDYLADGSIKEDLEKATAKMRSISIWDGSPYTRKELTKILKSYIHNRMFNMYDMKVLFFIAMVIVLASTVGSNGIKRLRKAIDIFWSYEENF